MTLWREILGMSVVVISLFTMLTGSIGIIRLPDFFARTHAASLVDTVGIIGLLLGFAIFEGLTLTSGKLLLAACFVALTNPVTAHALGRAALRLGMRPWRSREEVKK